jgi:hypothetical protein
MANKAGVSDIMDAGVRKTATGFSGASIGSVWEWECRDNAGNLKWKDEQTNTVQLEGLKAMLDTMFNGRGQVGTNWYLALFESDTSMTAGTHTYGTRGYTECTTYSEGTRGKFIVSGADGTTGTASITSSANKGTFTMSSPKTIYGGALVGGTGGTWVAVKNDSTSGSAILFCSSKFSTAKSVAASDVVTLYVTIKMVAG